MRAAPAAIAVNRVWVAAVLVLAPVVGFSFPWLDRALNPGAGTPSVISFLGAGLGMIALTAVLLFAGLRGVLPRSGVFLAAMFSYNALLVAIKFGLGPLALYVTSETRGLLVLSTDKGGLGSGLVAFLVFAALAAVTALLYGLAFFLLYLYFRSRLRRRLGINAAFERGFTTLLITMFVIGGAAAVSGLGIFAFLEYFFSFFSLLGLAALLALALLVALVLCGVAFQEATEQAVLVRNVTVLSSFAWVGIAFIAAYHIVWLVFILTLVALFPLKSMNVK